LLSALPSFSLRFASLYDDLVCPANQSAMLRAPVPAQSLLVVASAMRADWATRVFGDHEACGVEQCGELIHADSVIEHMFDRQPPNKETIKRDTHVAARNAEASREVLTPAGAHQAGHEYEQHK
jgi:hypothetical protein